jgi:hypothetical protein
LLGLIKGAFEIAISLRESVILNQIAENEPFGNCIFKKLRRKILIQIADNVVLF